MKWKAVLFDLDGTLLNTLIDLSNAVNRVLSIKGFPTHPIDRYRYFVGEGAKLLIYRALPEDKRTDKIVNDCLALFMDDYGQNWNVATRPYDGIHEMLDIVTAHGLKMAILSNKPHELTVRCITTFFPIWKFEAVFGQRIAIPKKPDPTAALEIAAILNIPPSEFHYLGDTAIDIKTAKAAQMHPVGVLWGFRPMEELKQSGADVFLHRPEDIIKIL
ncbi:MAG: HAD family hydrolase [Desulfobacterales bacterium]|nr:HAD family hydrolase [Desulfobacterales bacterium]